VASVKLVVKQKSTAYGQVADSIRGSLRAGLAKCGKYGLVDLPADDVLERMVDLILGYVQADLDEIVTWGRRR
jgi:hypothetical protein